MSYPRHELMTAPARKRRGLWRLAVGLALSVVIWFALAQGVVALLASLMEAETYLTLLEGLQQGQTPGSLILVLLLSGGLGIGAMAVAEILHARPGIGLLGPWRLFLPDFLQVTLALAALNLLLFVLPPWDVLSSTQPGLAFDRWLLLLPLTLGALVIQTGAEEVFFRGYFQSQLAARVRHPAIWMGVPSIAFGVGHYLPEVYGENALLVAGWSVVFGLAAADLTARSGNLGPALALHFVNNFMVFAIVSPQGDLSGLALRQLPFGPGEVAAVAALLPVDLAMIAVSWLTARVVLRV